MGHAWCRLRCERPIVLLLEVSGPHVALGCSRRGCIGSVLNSNILLGWAAPGGNEFRCLLMGWTRMNSVASTSFIFRRVDVWNLHLGIESPGVALRRSYSALTSSRLWWAADLSEVKKLFLLRRFIVGSSRLRRLLVISVTTLLMCALPIVGRCSSLLIVDR